MASTALDEAKANAEAEQAGLLTEAFGFAAEHRFYLRKAVQQGDLESALRHSLCLANELRSSQLSPESYYRLYALVFWELQHLADFLQDTSRHGSELYEIYEIVQYEGNVLPRLYMLVTVGMVRMLAPGEAPPDQIFEDLRNMLDAVQHPTRGLFLRYYLLQVAKDKLHRLDAGIIGALNFLLANFREAVSLWQRLRLQVGQSKQPAAGAASEAWQLDDGRYSLRLLIGSHLIQIARLQGLTVELYAKVVLPEVLRLITLCEDAAGQAYLLQCFVEVFPDGFHLHTLESLLAACAQVHWSVDLQPLMQHLLRRLTLRLAEGGDEVSRVAAGTDVFSLFHVHLNQLHVRPPAVVTTLSSLLALQLELCMSALALHPGDASCMELVLQSTVKLLESRGSNSEPLSEDVAEAVVDIMAAPLTQEPLVTAILQMPYHKSLMATVGRSMQRCAALAMVSAVLAGDVSICECATLQNLLQLADTLLRDEGGHENDGEENWGRHLEHDPAAFTSEQEAVACLVHQVRHEDPDTVLKMLLVLQQYFKHGGPHRLVFTMPAMVVAMLRLADQFTRSHGQQQLSDKGKSLCKVLRCSRDMCSSLGDLVPRECLRLWLLSAASADRAATAVSDEELVKICSSFVDRALSCLEQDVEGQEAQLCGLQLLVGTLRQMDVGLETTQLKAACERAVAFSCKLPTQLFQGKALCLCSDLFWHPSQKSQDPERGLLCLKKALQCADGAIHIEPLDVGLFIDILNQVAQLCANDASEVSGAMLNRLMSLCVQHTRYLEGRVPFECWRALRAALIDVESKQARAKDELMAAGKQSPFLYVNMDDTRVIVRVPQVVEAKS